MSTLTSRATDPAPQVSGRFGAHGADYMPDEDNGGNGERAAANAAAIGRQEAAYPPGLAKGLGCRL